MQKDKVAVISLRIPNALLDEIDKMAGEKVRSRNQQIIYMLQEKSKEESK